MDGRQVQRKRASVTGQWVGHQREQIVARSPLNHVVDVTKMHRGIGNPGDGGTYEIYWSRLQKPTLRFYDDGATCTVIISMLLYLWCWTEEA